MAEDVGGGARRRWRRWLAGTALLGVLLGGAGVLAFHAAFLTDLPNLEKVGDYRPPLTSRVVDRRGRAMGEFFSERRQLAAIDEIPEHTQRAFVAAEDSAFFEHSGIDYVSILRAAWVDLTSGEIRQGASTITMQLVKQLLLSPERRFRRKIREMILARRLEHAFSKQEILFLYLNHIYFGHGAHGIREAAYTYFDKDVSELGVAESALLAGLPQRPSAYSPFRNPEIAERRRQYVLRRMLADGVIDQSQYEEAAAKPPEVRSPTAREEYQWTAWFVEEVRRTLFERLGGDVVLNDGLVIETTADLDLQRSAQQAVRRGLIEHDHRQGWRGPIRRVKPDEVLAEAARLGQENELATGAALEESDAGDLELGAEEELAPRDTLAAASDPPEPGDEEASDAALEGEQLPADRDLLGVVLEVDRGAQTAVVAFSEQLRGRVLLDDVSWAREPDASSRPRPVTDIARVFAVGDVARFRRLPPEPEEKKAEPAGHDSEPEAPRVELLQEPLVEGALLSLEVETGDVLALVGGYDFERSQFNRATQAQRQPGSAFKPIIYGAALSQGYTPVSILYDRPIVYTDPISGFIWRPQNYSRHFYGPMPMRTALVRSVNNATVHLFRDLGVDFVIDYARRLGIQSPLSRDLSLALGSSPLTLVELTSAYAVFPNHGRRVIPRFISRVTDRDGQVLLEDIPLGELPAPVLKPLAADGEEEPVYPDGEILPSDQVISEETAYLMTDLLKAVVFDPRGTGFRLKALRRPVGGKTGTTNDQADAWFMGFSPDVATGVWVGHDESRVLGWGETGSRAAAPIWVDYMSTALAARPIHDFEAPEHIVFQRIDRETGLLASAGSTDAYFQPFVEGTEPTQTAAASATSSDTLRALREDSF